MKCIRIHAHGGLDQLKFEELPDPVPRAGEVKVRVHATSINRMDLWVRKGLPGVHIPLPMIPGVEAAGVVAETGPGVVHVRSGDRVIVAQGISCGHCLHCLNGNDNLCRNYVLLGEHRDGADAEYVIVPSRNVIGLSSKISFEQAAAAGLVFLTAWQMLVDKARVRPTEDVLVHGATSGVGSAAVQVAKLFGARVIATTSTDAKAAELRKIGADEVIIYAKQSVQEEVRRLTGKRGVDVVIDHVGAAVWTDSIRSLTKGGRLVTCGATSGYEATTDLRYVFYKQIQILGSTMGRKGDLMTILKLMEQGSLRPVIHAVLPMSEVREGHRIVEAGEHIGKIVLTV
ncbi:MAG: alcohol dehydrogenase [Ignavibacteria bacterium GWA2_55_11]|nr:MAG: alcohol dehydrogenase [Ignavibacteria bacterium GWA2_55_11]OGU68349.1 MAG: alcohol dehydrogenase [Ignavibacteria bacterium RIFCSPHIGHO2_02_FULL_56_12]OGU71312.1 MAG: alcohol dehydrogenase [Ignavibacteria bacterium RIFCSPLOWO2_12_FULL_56_21]